MFKVIKKVFNKIKDLTIKALNVICESVEEARLEMVEVEEVRLEEKKLYCDMAQYVMNWISSCAKYVLKHASNCVKTVAEETKNITKAGINEIKMISNNNKSIAKVGVFGFSLIVASALTILVNNTIKT